MQALYFSVSKFLFKMKANYGEPLEYGFPEARLLLPKSTFCKFVPSAFSERSS